MICISFLLKDSARDRKKGNHYHRYCQINEQNYTLCLKRFLPSDIMKPNDQKWVVKVQSACQSKNMVKTEGSFSCPVWPFTLKSDRLLLSWVSYVWGGKQNRAGTCVCVCVVCKWASPWCFDLNVTVRRVTNDADVSWSLLPPNKSTPPSVRISGKWH